MTIVLEFLLLYLLLCCGLSYMNMLWYEIHIVFSYTKVGVCILCRGSERAPRR